MDNEAQSPCKRTVAQGFNQNSSILNQKAEDLLMGAPSLVKSEQLKELNINLIEEEKDL